MAAEVDIANLALGRIGHTEALSSLTDQNKAGRNSARLYPLARDRAIQLSQPPWTQQIVPLAASLLTVPGWGYVYDYPSDCLHITAVCDAAGARYWSQPVSWREQQQVKLPKPPYQTFDGGGSTVIATDVADAYGVMNMRVTATTRYPPMFISGLAWLLAAELGAALDVDAKLIQTALGMADRELSQAAALSFNESAEDTPPDSPSIRIRG